MSRQDKGITGIHKDCKVSWNGRHVLGEHEDNSMERGSSESEANALNAELQALQGNTLAPQAMAW